MNPKNEVCKLMLQNLFDKENKTMSPGENSSGHSSSQGKHSHKLQKFILILDLFDQVIVWPSEKHQSW